MFQTGGTVTVTERLTLALHPTVLLPVIVYVSVPGVVVERLTLPLAPGEPTLVTLRLVVLELLQLTVKAWPVVTVVGETERLTEGSALSEKLTLWSSLPT